MAEIQVTVKVCDFCKPGKNGKQPKKATHTCSICGSDVCGDHVGANFTGTTTRQDAYRDSSIALHEREIYPLTPVLLCPSCTTAWRKVPSDIKKKLVAETLERYRPIIAVQKL